MLNWQVSTTIREAIWRKLEYKAARYAIRTKRVWPRDSSHECPRCGGPGVTCKSPEHRQQVSPYGHWFFCSNPACGYNGDRDYVASLNVGRRALIEGYSSDEQDERKPQPVSYRGTGTVLPFPSSESFRAMIERGASSGKASGIRQSPGPNSEAESLLEEGRFCQSLCQRLWTVLSGFNQAIKVGPMWLPGYG